jgi:hypothetical protein
MHTLFYPAHCFQAGVNCAKVSKENIRVMLLIMTSLVTVIYHCNIFIVQATIQQASCNTVSDQMSFRQMFFDQKTLTRIDV